MESTSITFVKPGRYVSLPVQNAPDVDMILVLDIKHQVNIWLYKPAAESWQVEFVGVPRRTAGGMAPDVPIGTLQRMDKRQRSLLSRLAQGIVDSPLDIPINPGTPDDHLFFHLVSRWRTLSRRPSKYSSSVAPLGSEAAPSSSSARNCVRF